jgi:tripeptidyl-peptidase-1
MLPPEIGVDHTAVAYIQKNCGLPEHAFDKFVGKNHESDCSKRKPSEDECFEAAIDSQIIATTAIDCHTEFWSPDTSFIGMFKFINDKGDAAPKVFSMSFGDVETERDDDTKDTEKEFAKIVAKGITMVASSGDNGAGQHGLSKTYKTNYPASSKYVLSVGGTSLKKLGEMRSGEVAVKDGYSSGGFSGLWTAPSWQGSATQDYLKSGAKMPSSGFSKTGRGVPDISALSGGDVEAWQTRVGSHWEGQAGTSTSAPFIASLIAKLNAKRLAAGMGTMGFLNPWLYSAVKTSGALFDVTEGSNSAKGNGGGGIFYCAKGWDPVTGLGTPNYEVLEKLALSSATFVV